VLNEACIPQIGFYDYYLLSPVYRAFINTNLKQTIFLRLYNIAVPWLSIWYK